MGKRYYRFAIKFAVERDVLIKADRLTDAMEKIADISPEMVLAEIDSSDFVFPSRINDQTQVYPEHDYLYRANAEGDELDAELLDDEDEV
jgi:hypothetical protein